MNFTARKLPRDAAPSLKRCPIHSVAPYALMLAPVYVYMRRNEKFVAIKSPLDFFTPEELERLSSFDSFFVTAFVDQSLPFRDAARTVRRLLSWDPETFPEHERATALPPAPYELSDAVLRVVGTLWGRDGVIDPFFVSVFVDELSPALKPEELVRAREQSIELFECAIYRSSWAVFLALHLGYCDLAYLSRARAGVFRATMGWQPDEGLPASVLELLEIARLTLATADIPWMTASLFSQRETRLSAKLASRFERVLSQFVDAELAPSSTRGPKGFLTEAASLTETGSAGGGASNV